MIKESRLHFQILFSLALKNEDLVDHTRIYVEEGVKWGEHWDKSIICGLLESDALMISYMAVQKLDLDMSVALWKRREMHLGSICQQEKKRQVEK